MKFITRTGLLFVMILALLAGSVHPAQASEHDEDGKIESNVTINDDLFLTGDQVVMDGTVNGLLFAAGETITIHGTVNGDAILFGETVIVSPDAKIDGNIFAGARTVKIEGNVTGSVFGGSGALTLADGAVIGRNLYYGGYTLQTEPGSVITRDSYMGNYQSLLDGEVQRDVVVGAAAVELTGTIGRNFKAYIGNPNEPVAPRFYGVQGLPEPVEPGLRVDESAVIGGKLVYTSEINQDQSIEAQPEEGIVYQTPVPQQNNRVVDRPAPIQVRNPALGWGFDLVRDLITLLAFGGLALWLIPSGLQRTIDEARHQTASSAGYGLLAIFSGYFAALVAFVVILLLGLLLGLLSLGGLTMPVFGIGFSALGFAMAVFSFLVVTGSKIVVALLIGQLLIDRAAPETKRRKLWSLLAGIAIYALISSIPFVGWLAALAATLIGVGAMWLAYRAWRKPPAAAAL